MKTDIRILTILLLVLIFTSCGNKPNKTKTSDDTAQSETANRPTLIFRKSFPLEENGWTNQMSLHATASNGQQYEFSIELPTSKDTTFVGRKITEEDINFDGYADILVELGYFGAGGGNLIYAAYVWETASSTFNKVNNYSDICNPTIDAKNKCIISHGRPTGNTIEYERYEWQQGKLVVTERWKEELSNQ